MFPNKVQELELSNETFEKISGMVSQQCGIHLPETKMGLVKARLGKRVSLLHLKSFDEYLHYIETDNSGTEMVYMLNAISTNVTSFFRDPAHFEFLSKTAFREYQHRFLNQSNQLRIWSAGCSTGEEAYSLAITVADSFTAYKAWDIKILGSDISTYALNQAKAGLYHQDTLKSLDPETVENHFEKDGENMFRLKANIKHLVYFARINFMHSWRIKGPFDIIFCRNVMIYFTPRIREELVKRFWDILAPDGWLILGTAESLQTIPNPFTFIQNNIYRKTL
ncbi:protein-glutamate O-methyltransferase CheR [bacterium]|nr:protein-glutamate O-methyltransferase CheR [bacterium]